MGNLIESIKKKNIIKKPSFESENKIKPLGMMRVIVDKYLEDSIKAILRKNGASAVYVKHGYGSATKAIYDELHLVEKHKAILFTLVTENLYYTLKDLVVQKLNTSKYAKGVILFKKLSSIGGVSNYKFFSHYGYVKGVKKDGK